MKFSNVAFYKSVSLNSKQVFWDDKPEVVFVGRSNMGKSSLMNTVFEKKDLVKTSSQPGKTRLANIFTVENKYYLTDLPGYGFAKLGKNLREELDGLISWYIEEKSENIKMVYMLIDSKIGPQETDKQMYDFLLELGVPVSIVLSKIDRMSRSELGKSLNYTHTFFPDHDILPVSVKSKQGITELLKHIKKSLLS